MKKNIILNILFGFIYYILSTIFFFYWCVFEVFYGNIIDLSMSLFCIIYFVIPFIFLILPIILKFSLNQKFYKSILYSFLGIVIYIFLILLLKFSINIYFKTFTIEKWSNSNWYGFRYLMIDDLEEKYNLIGMTKSEIYDILGKGNNKLKTNQEENVLCYTIRNGFLEGDYYLIYLNENDIVTKVDIFHLN